MVHTAGGLKKAPFKVSIQMLTPLSNSKVYGGLGFLSAIIPGATIFMNQGLESLISRRNKLVIGYGSNQISPGNTTLMRI